MDARPDPAERGRNRAVGTRRPARPRPRRRRRQGRDRPPRCRGPSSCAAGQVLQARPAARSSRRDGRPCTRLLRWLDDGCALLLGHHGRLASISVSPTRTVIIRLQATTPTLTLPITGIRPRADVVLKHDHSPAYPAPSSPDLNVCKPRRRGMPTAGPPLRLMCAMLCSVGATKRVKRTTMAKVWRERCAWPRWPERPASGARKPRSDKVKTGPVSSVGRASPW